MRKPLRCLVGFHAWYTEVTEDGEPYQACARCNAAEEVFDLTQGSGNATLRPGGGPF